MPLIIVIMVSGQARGAIEPVDVVAGIRGYTTGEQERWPAAGLTVGWGRDTWKLRPTVGASGALDIVNGGSETDLSAGLRWQDLGAVGARPLLGFGYARLHRSLGAGSGSGNAWFAQGGVAWDRGSGGHLGVSVRVLFGSELVTDDGVGEDVTSVEVGFLYGWHRSGGRGR